VVEEQERIWKEEEEQRRNGGEMEGRGGGTKGVGTEEGKKGRGVRKWKVHQRQGHPNLGSGRPLRLERVWQQRGPR